MLKEVNIEAILQDFGRQKRGEDPVIHFYEDFLREYDPKQKVKRGVFYTPDPVVSFIIRSVDYLLRKEFDCPDGLADTSTIPVTYKNTKVNGEVVEEVKQVPNVQILDPAVGTGTFLKYVIEEIKKTFDENHKGLSKEELKKEWNRYVDEHLLSRVFGFELLMAPYAIAHLKLGLKLKETGYDFLSHQRLGVSLTNALESGTASDETLKPYLGWVAQESKYSNYIKTSKNVSVVVGNPPYSRSSENKSAFIEKLMDDYKEDVRAERKYGVIEDDYVKFIRFAHWKLGQAGQGILGFITNNSYLSGVIHRGMRRKLLETFDMIYILDLHGSSRIGEKPPEGGKDENVFDIQQGVAIALYVKLEKPLKEKKVYYADLWGLRSEKYKNLFENGVESIDWQELEPRAPYYFFVPKDFALQEEYEEFWKVTEIFKGYKTGVETGWDSFFIDFDKQSVKARIFPLFNSNLANEDSVRHVGVKLKNARKKVAYSESLLKSYAYRPFDLRWIYAENKFLWRPKEWLQRQFIGENLALVTSRLLSKVPFNHSFVSQIVGSIIYITPRTKERSYFFPLYLYSDETKPKRTLNFSKELLHAVKEALGTEPTPEEIFYYIYAVLYSPTYRKRYEEFLKIDFPRVPLTSDTDLFKTLCRLGSELVSRHLMESPELDNLITEFKGEGDNVVAAIGKNSYKDGKLKINKTQYFEGIPEEVYNFHIGGYQVCQKWLKDRKGRELTEEEIEHYQKIVVALNETIRIMEEIDDVIEGHGGWPVR
jgi:predicted helicase